MLTCFVDDAEKSLIISSEYFPSTLAGSGMMTKCTSPGVFLSGRLNHKSGYPFELSTRTEVIKLRPLIDSVWTSATMFSCVIPLSKFSTVVRVS